MRKDTLSYLDRKDFAKDIRNQFVYVAKMFNEEMHVLAPKTIGSMKELDGKTVVVDLPDSSTFVTAINVFERLGIRPHLIYQEPRLAVDMLRKGEIDAIVAIEGKPLQWLNQVNDRNLHLVPVDYAKPLHEEYLPSKTFLGGLPEPRAGGPGCRDDRSRGAAGVVQLGAEQRPLPAPVAAGGDDVRQGRAVAAAAVPSKVEGTRAEGDGGRLDPLQGVAGLARPQHAAGRGGVGGIGRCAGARARRRLKLRRRSSAIRCIANSWSGGPAAPRPATSR